MTLNVSQQYVTRAQNEQYYTKVMIFTDAKKMQVNNINGTNLQRHQRVQTVWTLIYHVVIQIYH